MHISVLLQRRLCAYPAMELYSDSSGVRLFARRTFTTPKIRTFTTPQKKHLPGGQLPPPFFFFFWRTFLGFFDLQLMEDIKDGKEEVLDEVVMERIKYNVLDEVVMKHIK